MFIQTSAQTNIPISRLLFHEKIDKAQKLVLAMVKADMPNQATIKDALNTQIDAVQQKIEIDSSINNNQKIKYLRGTEDVLLAVYNEWTAGNMNSNQIPDLIQYYIKALSIVQQNESIVTLMEKIDPILGKVQSYIAHHFKLQRIYKQHKILYCVNFVNCIQTVFYLY